jgi:hypothetical protein
MLLKPAFAAQIHAVLKGRLLYRLAANTMVLVAHTIGQAALLGDGLVLEFLVMR